MKNLPNRTISSPGTCKDFISLLLVGLLCSIECLLIANCQLSNKSIAQNEIPRSSIVASKQTFSNEIDNQTNRSLVDVENLQLLSDFRSVKLRWTFARNRPTAFRIRYCELTSWNTEIKCRQRSLRVSEPVADNDAAQTKQRQQLQVYKNDANQNSSVILERVDSADDNGGGGGAKHRRAVILAEPTVRQLEPPSGVDFETQIYDLRALTNYTFQVQALALPGQQEARTNNDNSPPLQLNNNNSNHLETTATILSANHRSHSLARSLSLEFNQNDKLDNEQQSRRQQLGFVANKLPSFLQTKTKLPSNRIETKPFGAEAAKCLANVSEISVQTGKYFAGRISVENSNHPKCQLLGNKSSDQSVYLLRVDHEICRSKVVDGNRIETMILVHENKDILTHNSARFLVVCNFNHKSFTVKASVSLPKVNSLAPTDSSGSPTRPATITKLKNAPSGQQLRVGTMPVIYHPNQPTVVAANSLEPPASLRRETPATTGTQNDDHPTAAALGRLNDVSFPLSTTTTSAQSPQNGLATIQQDANYTTTAQSQRRAKHLADAAESLPSSSSPPQSSRTRSSVQQVLMPNPVEVASKALLFEPGTESSRGARLLELPSSSSSWSGNSNHTKHYIVVATKATDVADEENRTRWRSADQLSQFNAIPTDSARTIRRKEKSEENAGDSLTLTNNHRVAESFPALAAHNDDRLSLPATLNDATKPTSPNAVGLTNPPPVDNEQSADYSMKYSPSEVSEYSVSRLDQLGGARTKRPTVATATSSRPLGMNQLRSRSGRILKDPQARREQPKSSIVDSATTLAHKLQQNQNLESRMGDQASDLIVAESRQAADYDKLAVPAASGSTSRSLIDLRDVTLETTTPPPPPMRDNFASKFAGPTLAQNITGALLRWSVRTLENWARKSLESLAVDEDGNSTLVKQQLQPSDRNHLSRTVAGEEPASSSATIQPTQLAIGSINQKATLPAPDQSTRPMQQTTKSSQQAGGDSQQPMEEHESNGFIVHHPKQQPNRSPSDHNQQQARARKPSEPSNQSHHRGRLIETQTFNRSDDDDQSTRRQDSPSARAQKSFVSNGLAERAADSSTPVGDESLNWPLYVVVLTMTVLVTVICVVAYLSSVGFRVAASSLVGGSRHQKSGPQSANSTLNYHTDEPRLVVARSGYPQHLPCADRPVDGGSQRHLEPKLDCLLSGSLFANGHCSPGSQQQDNNSTAPMISSRHSDSSCQTPTTLGSVGRGQQSNRTTNEFIFTDHVLTSNCEPNESFA